MRALVSGFLTVLITLERSSVKTFTPGRLKALDLKTTGIIYLESTVPFVTNMLPSKSYKSLLAALQKAETLIPRPDQTSSGDDWSLYLRLLKLLSSVQTLHRKARRLELESDKKRNGKVRPRFVTRSA